MTATVLEFRDVTKTFRGTVLFENVSFSLEEGKTYALRGPNGSGKSVLMRLMTRITRPNAGEVIVADRYLGKGRVFPDSFGTMIDGPAYLPSISGLGNLLELARIRNRVSEEEIRALMLTLGLDPDSRKPVRRYSMGMKQKLSICQALMESPDVLILDEPFNALDDRSVEIVKDLIRQQQLAHRTIVLTSHNVADLDELAHHSLVVRGEAVVLE
ncbi:ABC transporter ATP-binding protein [Mycetocola tolaasinivorans]|uniref:ABC transporter ATP-binding protein n=1 Tax=Mycetocola tolaasinivorans TaxID=76635 RepID=A0A3L7A144_9MICO|nr:ABC transporter ATP-binding protein [Mycetocola tolaasinivorans]RLP73351.1 ABC transporter ATP-binding protein [Mycetocola tolaasinivorans]